MTERHLGHVGSRVLFENERVRVWEMKLAPGERSDLHRHDLDYLLVFLAGDVPVGRTVFVERGGVETAVNAGREHYREILIELKDEHTA